MRLAGLVWPRNLLSDLKNRRRSSGPIPLGCKEFKRGLERHLARHVKRFSRQDLQLCAYNYAHLLRPFLVPRTAASFSLIDLQLGRASSDTVRLATRNPHHATPRSESPSAAEASGG